ncbi:unnamed protein product [Victoria cruziana]
MAVCFGRLRGSKQWKGITMGVDEEKQRISEKKMRTKKKKDRQVAEEEWGKLGGSVLKKLRWEEVERITGNFASVIGRGGFSIVYLARLPGSGRPLGALKILNNSERLNRVFRQELDVLLRLRHENIVKLLGYCDEKEEGVLLFEMVPNGSLHEKLHEEEEDGGKTVLTWQQRTSIAFGVARALDYLHDRCEMPIVHCDVKASNVLLDRRLVPKLCDFGFARMGFSSAVLPSSVSPVMGSPGYVDPHYLRTGIVSKKNDVYSFGVLLLELLTGVEAFCSEKEQLLTCFAADLVRDPSRAPDFVDPRLAGRFDVDEARAVASVAASCLGEQLALRPSMADVLAVFAEKIAVPVAGKLCGDALKGEDVER